MSRGHRFPPCQEGVFESNLVVFDRRVRSFVNIGPGTSPDSFTLQGNFWRDAEGARKPNLPIRESDGRQATGLRLQRDQTGVLRPRDSVHERNLRNVGVSKPDGR